MKLDFLKRKPLILLLIGILIVAISIPTSVYAYNNYNYNKSYKLAKEALANEKFDDAVNHYKRSLKYNNKYNSEINSSIELVDILKKSKISYDEAVKLLNDTKYLESIEVFNKVSEKDNKYFEDSKLKANFSKNQYIKINLTNAKKEAENKNYDSALTFLDNILKIETLNQDAADLKVQYNEEIQKIKDEEAKKRAEEDAKKKAEEDAKKISSGGGGTNTSKTPAANYTISPSNGFFAVKDGKGNLIDAFGMRILNYSMQPNAIYYNFLGTDIPFKITFHLVGRDVSVSDKSSDNIRAVSATFAEVPKGANIKIDVSIEYKGKTYNSSFQKVINHLYP